MAIQSAGILLHRPVGFSQERQVLLGHMGGPFWAKKDQGAWSIVKGEANADENHLETVALREFHEETGRQITKPVAWLDKFKQPSGKIIHVWTCEDDWNLDGFSPGTFEMEWPKGSGKMSVFPEIDKLEWFDLWTATQKILKGQVPIIDAFARHFGLNIEPRASIAGNTDSRQGSLF